MNRYELTYIINTALEETARKELIEKFTELIRQNGGEIEKVDESWGKRRLAYPINDMPDGYYVLTTFTALGSQNKEIQRNLENSDMILRYLIIKLLDKKQSVKPKAVRPVAAPVREDAEPEQEEAAVKEPATEEAEAEEIAAEEAQPVSKAKPAVKAEPAAVKDEPADNGPETQDTKEATAEPTE